MVADLREKETTWGSHLPVLTAVLEVLRPQSALECGCGIFSTPLLRRVPRLHSIEHSAGWARAVRGRYPPTPGHSWTVERVPTTCSKPAPEVDPKRVETIQAFYRALALEEAPVDLLFVDTFAACRVPAVLALGPKAQWIVVHDLEPPGREHYGWPRLDAFFEDWKQYVYRPPHGSAWTGLASREPLDLDNLSHAALHEARRLWGQDVRFEEGWYG